MKEFADEFDFSDFLHNHWNQTHQFHDSSYDLAAITVRVPMYFETRPKPFYLGDIGDEEKVDDVFWWITQI